MRRSLVIARAELSAFLRSKSFLIGLLVPPAMAILAGFASFATQSPRPPPQVYRMAVVDPNGVFGKAIEQAVAKRNTETRMRGERGWVLIPTLADPGDDSLDVLRRDLAHQVQVGEIWAFTEIPADLMQLADPVGRVRIYAATTVGHEFETWFEQTLREVARAQALRDAPIPDELRARLGREIRIEPILLALRESEDPTESSAAKPTSISDQLGSFRGLPVGGPLALMVFLLISMSSGPLMQGVIEEKSNRVSEILLSSVSPFQLMLGKLLGSLAASGCGAILYLSVLIAALLGFGIELPPSLFVWFLVFLALGALLWGSVFLAIGAACTDIKDTQNLVLLSLVVQIVPLFFLTSIVMSPSTPTAVTLSLFPPSTPLVMLLRLSLEPAPPLWQPVLAALLLATCALAAVWIAGRIFRMGLLAHGRSATLREMWRWVRAD
jgi:ABC-2 type transport system permease protein